MDSIVGLGNRITYNFVAPGATKSHTSLDNIVNLGNRITYEIVYDFRRDRTTVELCSCKMHGETNLMSTYDVTESIHCIFLMTRFPSLKLPTYIPNHFQCRWTYNYMIYFYLSEYHRKAPIPTIDININASSRLWWSSDGT